MSARLIKCGANPAAFNFASFIPPQDQATPPQSGTVVPFMPRDSSEMLRPPAAQSQAFGYDVTVNEPRADEFQVEEIDYVANARAEAERIIAEAQSNAEQIRMAAQERGLMEARASIEVEVARMAEPLRQQLAMTLEDLSGFRASIAERAERDMVKLAIEIAKKIVHREVTIDHEVALTLARVALTRVHNRAQARIHLHPEDFTYISKHLDRLTTGSSIELVEDRAVSRGGCLVETEMGDMDARIEKQFEELERSFLGA